MAKNHCVKILLLSEVSNGVFREGSVYRALPLVSKSIGQAPPLCGLIKKLLYPFLLFHYFFEEVIKKYKNPMFLCCFFVRILKKISVPLWGAYIF
jgi:hypothetical protein